MKIVAVEPIGISSEKAEELAKAYEKKGHEFIVFPDRNEQEAILIERMKNADIVIVSNIRLRKEVLEQCSDLKFLNVAFTGLDHIDMKYCGERGIEVRNAAGYATEAVAELAVGMMLDMYRKITPFDSATRNLSTRNNILGSTGAIGLKTAGILKAFGCRLLAYSRSQRKEALEMGMEYTSLEDLMRHSDIISLHTPLTDQTHNMINRDMLSLCKTDAIIVNTARGGVIDNAALAEMLNEGKIAGAATDVYETEPPLKADHPLLSAKNTLLLPHVAYATRESFDARIDIIIDNLNRYLENAAR